MAYACFGHLVGEVTFAHIRITEAITQLKAGAPKWNDATCWY
jgi:hypothetical protein